MSILLDTLALSVPIRIAELQKSGGPTTADVEKARANMSKITGAIFRGSDNGRTAEEFNAASDALAILAFADGGIKFADLHFDVSEHGRSETETRRTA